MIGLREDRQVGAQLATRIATFLAVATVQGGVGLPAIAVVHKQMY